MIEEVNSGGWYSKKIGIMVSNNILIPNMLDSHMLYHVKCD